MFAGYLKLSPVFIFLLPGMIAVALYKQGVAGLRVDGANPQGAFRVLVSNLLPVGLRGLVLAGMLSALMSALASLFNSTATLFTVDFYKRLRPQSSEKHLVFVGRLATAAVILLGMAWIPFLQDLGKGSALHLPAAGAVAARAVDRGGLHARHLLARRHADVRPDRHRRRVRPRHGAPRAASVARDVRRSRWPRLVQAFVDINWLYFSFLLFVFTCVLIFAVSLVTPKASPEQLAGLTYRLGHAGAATPRRATSYGFWEIFHTVVILGDHRRRSTSTSGSPIRRRASTQRAARARG